ncbi:sensor histidine kinase [Leptospira barantonii]|uniref:histidine kinase n=1 Tax=Leptospira barantonii TaxID=2023184 RepID=A0ABX4NKW4_9LEPT|nr:ATP-binding protein [Leptospira barantonii]PJZ56571.1 histidine kinase [Leptospira barantonii]
MTESDFQILSHLKTPIGVLDKDLHIIICNSSFANRCSRKNPEELKSQDLTRILPFQNISIWEEFKNSKLEKTIYFKEHFKNESAEEFDFKGTLTRQRSGADEVLFLEISDSTSERTRNIQEKEIATIVSRMYHDLQEPIRNHTTFLKFVSEKYSSELDGKGKEFLQLSVEGANRLWNRINGLLLFLRIEKERNVFKTLSLKEVLEESILPFRESLDNAGMMLSFNGEFPEFVGNLPLLKELFGNLISNSIQFKKADADRILSFSYIREEDRHVVRVKDNGIGIDLIEKNNFIDLFKKYHIAEEFSGPGTGLFFCKRIAELHRGGLEIRTDGISGFEVIVSFPLEFKLEQL